MPDVYAAIAEVDVATQERLATILELRAADPQQRAMLDSYLSEVEFAPSARVLDVGCGTGAVTRYWRRPRVAEAVGVDPSSVFVAKAGELAAELGNVSFEEGDGRALRFGDGDFDVVVCRADALASSGRIGPELSAALKAEARRRAEADEFFGFIGFASFIAR